MSRTMEKRQYSVIVTYANSEARLPGFIFQPLHLIAV